MPFKERLKSGEPRKPPKQSYVPQNWSEYNKSLRKRGMLSLYLPKGDLGSQLINDESYKKGQPGREQVYTPAYVNLLFMLYRMSGMGLREFAGFMHDYWCGRGVELPVPSFGHLSDLFASLDITVRKKCVRAAERLNEGEPVTVIVDGTGLRFSHASAWYEKKYGKKAERTPWRMMHLAMDAEATCWQWKSPMPALGTVAASICCCRKSVRSIDSLPIRRITRSSAMNNCSPAASCR